jgi:hypothetical protein
MRRLLSFVLLAVAPLCAQQTDFLTADEADQLREAQEIDARLKLYVQFARARVGMFEAALAKDTTGRSGYLHELLEQYAQIIEAIDTVVDDALSHQRPPTSMNGVLAAERDMLARLEKTLKSAPRDLARYKFVLDQAIETTRDSIEISEADLKERGHSVAERDRAERKEKEALMASPNPAEKKPEEKKADEAPKKRPSLYRKGEKKDEKK